MTQQRNRGRMAQCETTCKILRALGAGRWTPTKIATFAGVNPRTARRYIHVLSLYFSIHEYEDGRQHYYWLDDAVFTVRGHVPERFCSRGHDKLAPHGGYYVRYPQGVYLCCAICKRATNNRSYARHGRKTQTPALPGDAQ